MKINKFTFSPKKEMAMIRAAIFELGKTQEGVANAIGKSPALISLMLRGRKKFPESLEKVKSYLASEILKQDRKSCNK